MESYGQKIKECREQNNFTQEEVANKLGITRPTYVGIESGKRSVTLDELSILCKLFDLTLEQFLFSSTQAKSYEGKMTRFKQIILQCLRNSSVEANAKVSKTKLFNLVYICDFAAYRENKKPLSGLSYRHGEKGPVVDAFYRMIFELYDEGSINVDFSGRAILISANEPTPSRSKLSDEEILLIERECRPWKDQSTQDILSYVREQTPWKDRTLGEIIPYELALK